MQTHRRECFSASRNIANTVEATEVSYCALSQCLDIVVDFEILRSFMNEEGFEPDLSNHSLSPARFTSCIELTHLLSIFPHLPFSFTMMGGIDRGCCTSPVLVCAG